jgi:hypothetical protein
MTAMLGVFATAQGPATHNVPPAVRAPPSGRPFPVTFTDVAREAGMRMSFTSGNESSKKYIIEANGSGVAFLDYDNDGRQDIFLVNGSRLEGFRDGEVPLPSQRGRRAVRRRDGFRQPGARRVGGVCPILITTATTCGLLGANVLPNGQGGFGVATKRAGEWIRESGLRLHVYRL